MGDTMKTYSEHRPTSFDSHIPLEDREHWIMAPVSRNRDSDLLQESNFSYVLDNLGGTSETVEVHRFGHWANGWYEIILVDPSDYESVADLEVVEERLSNYPILDELDLSEREGNEAHRVWSECYSTKERLEYMRKRHGHFEFRHFRDMLSCARGDYFPGDPSEIL